MANKTKTHKLISIQTKEDKIVYLEGACIKCKSANNSLVIMDVVKNAKLESESIIRTRCLVCEKETILRLGNIDTGKDE